jgi:hypothetical protein
MIKRNGIDDLGDNRVNWQLFGLRLYSNSSRDNSN